MSSEGVTKRCTKCGEVKGLGEFYVRSRSRDGKTSACKKCSNASSYDYSKRNNLRVRAINMKYVKAHRDEINKRTKQYKSAKRANDNLWLADVNAKRKLWRRLNPDTERLYRKRSSQARKVKITVSYIASVMRMPVKQVTPELLALKRQQITYLRLARQLRKELRNESI